VSAAVKTDPALVKRIEDCLRQPVYFSEIFEAVRDQNYRAVMLAWSDVRTRKTLERDEYGRFWMTEP
jgi:hypothetical protein